MEDKFFKYSELLLVRCLGVKRGQPIIISAPVEAISFVRVLTKCAISHGVFDIYYDWYDDELKHLELLGFDDASIEKSLFWNKSIYDDYAKRGGAFLMLVSEDPDIMLDVPAAKVACASRVSTLSRPIYKEKQLTDQIAWCIASVSTYGWAHKIFDGSDCVNKLWNLIFDVCYVNCGDPIKVWDDNLAKSSLISMRLSSLNLKELHYTNSLGTDLYVGFSKNTIWCGALSSMLDGTSIVCNMPSFEVFTSPNRVMTNGVVYNSKPLIYNGAVIDDFMIEFCDGRVVNFSAEIGYDVLKGIINGDDNSCYLGEVALVNNDSPISNKHIIFYTTLFDENASCHLALGAGFPNCLGDTSGLSKEELLALGINMSDVHVDFMIGTSDLKIEGITYDGDSILIFENGNFVIDL